MHAEGGYLHDLRAIKFENANEGLWRRAWAMKKNANLYPTLKRICDEIRRGVPASRAKDTLVIPDRRDAIARALESAGPGDVVVIAGKGHETYQVLGTDKVPFDEREIVSRAVAGER